VTKLSDAFALLSLVDQIYKYGKTQHREFVIKHIEPWLAKAEKLELDREKMRWKGRGKNAVLGSSFHEENRTPGWARSKFAGQIAKAAKAQQTRERNYRARYAEPDVKIVATSKITKTTNTRRYNLRSIAKGSSGGRLAESSKMNIL
jgi:hypothetical protein